MRQNDSAFSFLQLIFDEVASNAYASASEKFEAPGRIGYGRPHPAGGGQKISFEVHVRSESEKMQRFEGNRPYLLHSVNSNRQWRHSEFR
ncbi:hypothetical protein [Paraburkholderia terricola]|uniref:Uncharacterized protein n=1 Tax=Paraburkholderia terricola TaxID=169427 RepID=A0ABU1LRB6_9BURK|nr:hypothetical protein [Paraburkholderia terricola]MDR6409085.1 hypothetical protein [Paraburkholderia terricola]MDR6482015.1 hypothetical protein [Paraburkholderia terricola]